MKKLIMLLMMAFAVIAISCSDDEASKTPNDPTTPSSSDETKFLDAIKGKTATLLGSALDSMLGTSGTANATGAVSSNGKTITLGGSMGGTLTFTSVSSATEATYANSIITVSGSTVFTAGEAIINLDSDGLTVTTEDGTKIPLSYN